MVRALLLVALVAVARAGMAPNADKAADYPEGWCDARYGTPTRTTGECMCKHECEGRGCERGQGFVWYSYAKCKACACVAAPAKTERAAAPAEPEAGDDAGDDDPYGEAGYAEYQPPAEEPDEALSLGERLFEFVDENGNAIFAVLFTVVLLCVMVPALILNVAAAHKKAGDADAPPATPAPQKKKSDDKKSDDDASDDDDDAPPSRKKTPKCD